MATPYFAFLPTNIFWTNFLGGKVAAVLMGAAKSAYIKLLPSIA
jgi:hypothetical protein